MLSLQKTIQKKIKQKEMKEKIRRFIADNVRYGIELEGYYVFDAYPDFSYFTPGEIKTDGSLYGLFFDEKNKPIPGRFYEICTDIYRLKEYRENNRYFVSELAKFFKDIMYNYTMGTHIHFSFISRRVLNLFDNKRLHNLLKRSFSRCLKKADFLTSEEKEQILRRYYRDYAKRGVCYGDSREERYYSLHGCTRLNTLEWRSPNMGRLKGFAKTEKMLNLICEALEDALIRYFLFYSHEEEFPILSREKNNTNAIDSGVFLSYVMSLEYGDLTRIEEG